MATRLVTEWSAERDDDGVLRKLFAELDKLPEFSPERLEAEAGLHMLQARWCWRRADLMRESERKRERRSRKTSTQSKHPDSIG